MSAHRQPLSGNGGKQDGADSLVPGVSPQVYSRADFDRVAALVKARAGIVLSDGKAMLAYSRLAPLLRRSNCATFGEYLDHLESDAQLTTKTVAALTTNHTYFNRESHHFEHFENTVRPDLVERAKAGETMRIWSAGCSSGEEIWTLMLTLLGADKIDGKQIARSKIIALASDLAEHAVTAAEQATYPADTMAELPDVLLSNWCKRDAGTISIGQELRNMVRFRQLNLLMDWPFKAQFDVIFCRNVMIYFDQPTKERLVARLANQLRPGAYLYIGHSERVSGAGASLLEPVGPTIYQRKA